MVMTMQQFSDRERRQAERLYPGIDFADRHNRQTLTYLHDRWLRESWGHR